MSSTLLVNTFHHEIAAVWHTLSHILKAENHHHHHSEEDALQLGMNEHHEHRIINQFIAHFKMNHGSADEHSTFIFETITHKICHEFYLHFSKINLLERKTFVPYIQHKEAVYLSPASPPPNTFS
jgi:hypothetical protein